MTFRSESQGDDNDDDDDDDDDDAGSGNGGTCEDDDEDDAGGGTTTPIGTLQVGDDQANALVGSIADDTLIARGDDDVVMAGAGDDIIRGDAGDDFLNGESGFDVIFGGTGNDDILGGEGGDTLYGEAGADRIFGGAGNDLIDAGADDDTVFGGAGNDTIVARQGDGNDTHYGDEMEGGEGIDTLDMSAVTANVVADLGTGLGGRGSAFSSQSGNDTLWGMENIVTGSGDDTITASSAINVIDGGQGADTFRFLSTEDADGDTIVSFQPGDKIDLSGVDAVTGASGNQSFTLVSDAFSGAAGELLITYETRDGTDFTVIEGNTAGGRRLPLRRVGDHQHPSPDRRPLHAADL